MSIRTKTVVSVSYAFWRGREFYPPELSGSSGLGGCFLCALIMPFKRSKRRHQATTPTLPHSTWRPWTFGDFKRSLNWQIFFICLAGDAVIRALAWLHGARLGIIVISLWICSGSLIAGLQSLRQSFVFSRRSQISRTDQPVAFWIHIFAIGLVHVISLIFPFIAY